MVHRLYRKNHHWFAEHRLIGRETSSGNEHTASLEEALKDFNNNGVVPTAADFQKRTDALTNEATHQIQNESPTWMQRINRFVGGGAARMIGLTVDSADKATVNNTINRVAIERTANARRELEVTTDNALRTINSRAHKTDQGFTFLNEKSAVCADITESLQHEIIAARKRLEMAGRASRLGKRELTRSIDLLSKRQEIVRDIRSDVQKEMEDSAEGKLIKHVQEADAYLREIIVLYKPESAHEMNAILMDWVNEQAGAGHTKTSNYDLARVLKEVAFKMFPTNPSHQRAQLQVMMNVANRLSGKESKWGILSKTTSVATAGTVAALGGSMVLSGGMAAGVLGGAALAKMAYNKVRYGTAKKDSWNQSRVAMYYQNMSLQAERDQAAIREISTLPERLKKLKTLKPGTEFSVENKNDDLAYTYIVLAARDGVLFAADDSGRRYTIDTKGDKSGTYYFSFQENKNAFTHMKISLGEENGAGTLFAIS